MCKALSAAFIQTACAQLIMTTLFPAPGLPRLLAEPTLQANVFVPTNRAFFNLLRVLGQTKGQLLSEQERSNLLKVMQARA